MSRSIAGATDGGAEHADGGEQPERRPEIDRTHDHQAVDLIARYAHTLDSGDLDGYLVALLMREGRAGPPPNGEVAYRHFVGAPTIDNGDGKATVHVLHRLSGRFPGSQPVVTRS